MLLTNGKAIINDKLFKKTFPDGINSSGVLSKMQKAFDEENKAGEFLRMKGFYTMKKLTDKEMMMEGTFKEINACFKTTKPLIDFLNRAIEND